MEISAISSSMNFDPASMFKKLDNDNSGGISKEEFLANVKRMDGDSDEKLLKMFEETDSDGDGVISQAENEAAMKKMEQGGQRAQRPQGPPPSGGATGASKSNSSDSSESSTTYDARDLNKDGTVSAEEKLAYILKLLQETEEKDSTQNQYTQSGESTSSSNETATTFSIKA